MTQQKMKSLLIHSIFLFIITLQQSSSLSKEDKQHLRGLSTSSSSENDNKSQRVILIAGPHKTGSSSIQANMYNWMMKNITDTSLTQEYNNSYVHPDFQQWAWPEPKDVYDHSEKFTYTHAKIFYPFAEALHGCKMQHRKELNQVYGCARLIAKYRTEIRKYWKQGYNIVIGTEAFDTVGADESPLLVDSLLDQMPWSQKYFTDNSIQGQNDDITVVIKYRSPRILHLMSWWHQCCMKKMNFYHFLLTEMEQHPDRGSRIVDSLQLAERFLEKGLNVVLIDVSGVIESGYDLSNVIACDVMSIPCTKDKIIEGSNQLPDIKNQKSNGDMGRITEKQINAINKVIRRRDCSFQHLAWNPKLTILYPLDITNTLLECKSGSGISRKEMNLQILDIVKSGIPDDGELE